MREREGWGKTIYSANLKMKITYSIFLNIIVSLNLVIKYELGHLSFYFTIEFRISHYYHYFFKYVTLWLQIPQPLTLASNRHKPVQNYGRASEIYSCCQYDLQLCLRNFRLS
jgi:hypothetical protein